VRASGSGCLGRRGGASGRDARRGAATRGTLEGFRRRPDVEAEVIVQETGLRNSAHGADKFGLMELAAVHWNLGDARLYEHAIANHEGSIVQGGAFCAETGVHTGRSPKDKFVVCDETTEKTVWWEKNGKLSPAQFDLLHKDFLAHANGKQLFVPTGFAHGFLTLADGVSVLYKVSDYYAPSDEGGIRWDDPNIAFPWPLQRADIILSERDERLPFLADFDSPFPYDGNPLAELPVFNLS